MTITSPHMPVSTADIQSIPNTSYHIEPYNSLQYAPQDQLAEHFLKAFDAILCHTNYRFVLDLYTRSTMNCGRCADACQVFRASTDPHDIPCYRTSLLLDIYRQYFTPKGALQNRLFGPKTELNEIVSEIAEQFYRCTTCRRCKLECPLGIDHGLIVHLGRYILSEAGIAPKGLVVSVREQLQGKTGNTSGLPLPALLDNLEFLQEEFEDTKGRPLQFPIDQIGAEYIFFPAVSDYLVEADTLMGIAAVLQAAGISWTIGTGYFDGINYGLFYNDWVLENVIKKLVSEAYRLDSKKILIGECGHAARSAKQYVPAYTNERTLPVVSILELSWKILQTEQIKLQQGAIPERITYHDPCNIARSGWIVNQPRQIIKSIAESFVEMKPNGAENYCCGGGGGLVSLDETHEFRMQVAGKLKAEQIAKTDADLVVTPCANCKKQLRELADYYNLPVQIIGIHDLILRAIQ